MFTPKANSKRKMVKPDSQESFGRWAGADAPAQALAGSIDISLVEYVDDILVTKKFYLHM